jgi:hypothetical protein
MEPDFHSSCPSASSIGQPDGRLSKTSPRPQPAFQKALPPPFRSSRKSSGDVRSRQSGERKSQSGQLEPGSIHPIPHSHALPWINAVQPLKSADLLAARPSAASWMLPKSGRIQSAPRRGWVRPYRGSPDDAPMIKQAPSARLPASALAQCIEQLSVPSGTVRPWLPSHIPNPRFSSEPRPNPASNLEAEQGHGSSGQRAVPSSHTLT